MSNTGCRDPDFTDRLQTAYKPLTNRLQTGSQTVHKPNTNLYKVIQTNTNRWSHFVVTLARHSLYKDTNGFPSWMSIHTWVFGSNLKPPPYEA